MELDVRERHDSLSGHDLISHCDTEMNH